MTPSASTTIGWRKPQPARDPLGELDGFLARPVLIDDGGDDAAQVVELQFPALAGDDRHTRVAEQPPVLHGVEDVLSRHAALLREQHRLEGARLGIAEQLLKLAPLARLGAGLPVVLVAADDAEPLPLGEGLDVLPLPGGAVLLLVGAHADVADRRPTFIFHRNLLSGWWVVIRPSPRIGRARP
jgi:hypothetical protein